VLEPEPTNPVDPNAICVLIDDELVGYLAREDAQAYIDGLHALISGCSTGCIGLRGVIAGGGIRDGRRGFLGVFLDHDPADFGVHHHFIAMEGELRTGYSQARATDLADDSYDLSWGDTLPDDPWKAVDRIERLLVEERDPIDRHFMFAQLEKSLYRCRSSHADAFDRFDNACRRHDAEMDILRPVLIAKFGCVPVIEMYHQAVIRYQKAKDWDQMRSWAIRALSVYGDESARPEELVDLQKRVTYATAKLEAPMRSEKSRSREPSVVAMEVLVCVTCGSSFERPRARGRKPRHCPRCS
jgi:predicted Zn-ribbon and HTH transcriptional regulator